MPGWGHITGMAPSLRPVLSTYPHGNLLLMFPSPHQIPLYAFPGGGGAELGICEHLLKEEIC